MNELDTADALLLAGHLEAAIDAYERILEARPELASLCYSQMGTAWFFLGRHDRALGCYEAAKRAGADAGILDDHIRDAWEALGSAGRA